MGLTLQLGIKVLSGSKTRLFEGCTDHIQGGDTGTVDKNVKGSSCYIVDDPCESDGLNNNFNIKNVRNVGPKVKNIKHNFDMQCHLKLKNETDSEVVTSRQLEIQKQPDCILKKRVTLKRFMTSQVR